MTADLHLPARRLSNGNRCHRCALQVNPHDFLAGLHGRSGGGAPAEQVRTMVDSRRELGISVLAPTDHDAAESIEESPTRSEASGGAASTDPEP
ncbi:MAG: hypothetical protein FJ265_01225 [Planctomycetes bacterium]|nr:hypothetical protein [Planctomycetota bacterium]